MYFSDNDKTIACKIFESEEDKDDQKSDALSCGKENELSSERNKKGRNKQKQVEVCCSEAVSCPLEK